MRILIFEGIATSGKSTIIDGLRRALPTAKVEIASEADTHVPITKETTDKHIEFFEKLIDKFISKRPDLLIFDRLYLTQAFRAKTSIKDYPEIEKLLIGYPTTTIFLKVDEVAIESRISKAAAHRGSDYFRSRGETKEEIAQYYINQQRNILELLEQSIVPNRIFDTTHDNYDEIVQEILKSTK